MSSYENARLLMQTGVYHGCILAYNTTKRSSFAIAKVRLFILLPVFIIFNHGCILAYNTNKRSSFAIAKVC